MESDYHKWLKGEMIYNVDCEKLVPIDDENYINKRKSYINKYGEEDGLELLKEEYRTYEEYIEHINGEYEDFVDTFTTPSGEKIVGFGYHGYNY
jgi:hypothetical protein